MACEGHLVEWVSDKLRALLGCSESAPASRTSSGWVREECSSMGDLVCRLVEFGLAPSAETCRFAADVYAKVPRRPIGIGNYPKQEIAAELARKQSTYNLLVNEDENDTDNQSSTSGQSLASQPS
ncbi:hypothetical protein ACP4OV_001244 [Aristida adscensionis]